jgi:hypothetical protein
MVLLDIHKSLSAEKLALQRKHYTHLTDEEFRFMVQQVDGRQRTHDKLPTFAQIEDWWYPVRLSCEQCSSEATAQYKSSLLPTSAFTLTDLTGGYGVDTYFMSEHASEVHYVERNEDLCKIVAHNFQTIRPQVHIHNTDAIHHLHEMASTDVIYLDPARRDQHGGKVFRLEDCEPNVIDILPTLRSKSKLIIIKLSPMLDITQALHSLKGIWDVHIVAVKNEVKEVLLVSNSDHYHHITTPKGYRKDTEGIVYATNILPTPSQNETYSSLFSFSQHEEKDAQCQFFEPSKMHLLNPGTYIYEPNAAIIKAGAYKLVAKRYDLCKMATNTHLYLSDKLVTKFPGRVWKLISTDIKKQKDIRANIMTRNYPLSPEQLHKKLKIKDSDTHTVIGARLAEKPILLFAERIDQHTTSC